LNKRGRKLFRALAKPGMMRWGIALLAVLALAAGCLGGSEDEAEPAEIQADANASDDRSANASDNATYLEDEDYNQTHVHDYWPNNATEKVLMDEIVETDTMRSVFYTTFSPFFDEPHTSVGYTYFSLPNGSFVPEGTGTLTVEVDATSALERGQMSLAYRHASAAEFTEMDPQGEQATWEIDVQPEMVDLPHAKSTEWAFRLEAEGTGAILDGEMNVRVTAEKTRDLDAWPEHPDPWNQGERSKLHLFNVNETFDRTRTFAQEPVQEEKTIHFPEGTLVPSETDVLLVKFWWGFDDNPRKQVAKDVDLRVKEGDSSSWYSYQDHRVIDQDDNHKMYALPVDGSSWDSPYADQSTWSMQLAVQTGPPDPADVASGFESEFVEAGSGNVTIDATAYRDVPPWLESMMAEEGVDENQARG